MANEQARYEQARGPYMGQGNVEIGMCAGTFWVWYWFKPNLG